MFRRAFQKIYYNHISNHVNNPAPNAKLFTVVGCVSGTAYCFEKTRDPIAVCVYGTAGTFAGVTMGLLFGPFMFVGGSGLLAYKGIEYSAKYLENIMAVSS
jgi:hypothetical protein